jgi:hypothetical protein
MTNVRKGDAVVMHGRALIDGRQVADAIVTGVGDNGQVSAKIDRGNGTFFELPGTAGYGPSTDGANWWDWPRDSDNHEVVPTRDDAPADDA